YKDTVYWFRFEPIEWFVLEPSSGLIFTKKILDSQAYNNTHESVSDFSESSIKQYLNDNWINTALNVNDLSAITTSGDKITLLTESQAENENYGFTSDDSRKGTVTDYSIVNGNVVSNIGSDIVANWILKDKYDDSNINSVSFFGKFSFCDMNSVRGIRPVTNIDLTKANRFSITYRLNGEIIKTEEYEQGEAVIPYTPEIEGYTFNGWDTVIPQTMPAHSIEANANVTVNSYSLTLDANGGIFADNSSIKESVVEYNSPLIPEEPTREGYTFDRWENSHDKMPADDLTMTAIWNESEDTPYKINTYKENLNGEYDCETEIRQGRTNGTINLEPEEPEGYVLDTEKSELTGSISPDGKSEFSVYYNLKEYELTFDFSGESETITHTYKHGQQIDPPVIPRRTGFAGKWDKDIPDVCTSSETYSVIWLEDSFSITFNTAGGSNINNAVYKFGAQIIKPDDPVKEGWTFVGWDKEFPETMPAEDLEFTALWKVNTYSVRWNANGDTKEETYTYGEKIREPIIIENDGYTFAGWDKAVPSAMPAENLEFNAVFTEKRFNLTWIADGSTLKRETYKYGETIIEPSVPERAGFTFSWNNHTDTMPAKDITISGTYTKASI
ncbi:MAG: InlB B-repeat-containing protein, partial [Clostridia bacterium]|nr:InlB B-repeat-containing protein [Clostridia bacterium]